VLAGLGDGKSTLKSLIHSRLVAPDNKKKIYALVCQYLKYRPVIQELMGKGFSSFHVAFFSFFSFFSSLVSHLLRLSASQESP